MRSLMIPTVAVCAMLAAGAEPAGPGERGVSPPAVASAVPVPPMPPPKPQRPASCVIKVSCDPLVLPLGVNTLNVLLNTTGVANQAARQVFGEREVVFEVRFSPIGSAAVEPSPAGAFPARGPARFGGMPGMGPLMSDRGSEERTPFGPAGMPGAAPIDEVPQEAVVGVLEVIAPAPADAEKLLAAVCERLRDVLSKAQGAEAEQLAARISATEEEAARAQDRLNKLYEQRREMEQAAGGEVLTR